MDPFFPVPLRMIFGLLSLFFQVLGLLLQLLLNPVVVFGCLGLTVSVLVWTNPLVYTLSKIVALAAAALWFRVHKPVLISLALWLATSSFLEFCNTLIPHVEPRPLTPPQPSLPTVDSVTDTTDVMLVQSFLRLLTGDLQATQHPLHVWPALTEGKPAPGAQWGTPHVPQVGSPIGRAGNPPGGDGGGDPGGGDPGGGGGGDGGGSGGGWRRWVSMALRGLNALRGNHGVTTTIGHHGHVHSHKGGVEFFHKVTVGVDWSVAAVVGVGCLTVLTIHLGVPTVLQLLRGATAVVETAVGVSARGARKLATKSPAPGPSKPPSSKAQSLRGLKYRPARRLPAVQPSPHPPAPPQPPPSTSSASPSSTTTPTTSTTTTTKFPSTTTTTTMVTTTTTPQTPTTSTPTPPTTTTLHSPIFPTHTPTQPPGPLVTSSAGQEGSTEAARGPSDRADATRRPLLSPSHPTPRSSSSSSDASITSSSSSSPSDDPPTVPQFLPDVTIAPPHLPIIDFLPGKLRGRARVRYGVVKGLCSALVESWLKDAVARVRGGRSLDRSPLAFGPPLLFAKPFKVEYLEVRAELAARGDWAALAEAVKEEVERDDERRRASQHTQPPSVRRQRLAGELMERGLVSKAVRCLKQVDEPARPPVEIAGAIGRLFEVAPSELLRDGVVEVDGEAPSASRVGHSAVRRKLVGGGAGRSAQPWNAIVRKAVTSLGRGSAAGPCGLRRDILLTLMGAEGVLVAFANLVDLALTGVIRDRYLTASRLELIPKPGGGARPIGMGSILRRVSGKLAARTESGRIRPFAEANGQMALSEQGTGRVYRRVRGAAADGKWIVALDITNAFNNLDREVVRKTIARHTAPARAFATACYGSPSRFVARAHLGAADVDPPDGMEAIRGLDGRMHLAFETERGVIQGCPLAPLLFATSIAQMVEERKQRWGSVTVESFADDMYLIADHADELVPAIRDMSDALQEMGLALSPGKCQTLPPTPGTTPAELVAVAPEVSRLTVMGGPVVCRSHPDHDPLMREGWASVADRVTAVIRAFRHLQHPQHILRALQQAGGWSRIAYFASLEGALDDASLTRVEEADCGMLMCALRRWGRFVTPLDWMRCTLPVGQGGLGIKAATFEARIRRPTFGLYLNSLESGLDSVSTQRTDPDKAAEEGYRAVVDLLMSVLPNDRAARLAELRGPHANGWLTGPAQRCDGTLIGQPDVASVCLALAAGIAVLPADVPECPGANGSGCRKERDVTGANALFDRFGEHASRCDGVGSRRHKKALAVLEDTWKDGDNPLNIFSEAGCDEHGNPIRVREGLRPGDVAYKAKVSDVWTFVDYTAAATPNVATTATTRDPFAGAREARRRKVEQPHHRSISGRTDVKAEIVAQGSAGGLDKLSYAGLGSFVTAAEVTRDDGHNPTAVLAQRLQVACLTEIAELVLKVRHQVSGPVPMPLSGPVDDLPADEQVVIRSMEQMLRQHPIDAMRTRWRGAVEQYVDGGWDEEPRIIRVQQPQQQQRQPKRQQQRQPQQQLQRQPRQQLFRSDQHRQPQQEQHQRRPISREQEVRTARVVRWITARNNPPRDDGHGRTAVASPDEAPLSQPLLPFTPVRVCGGRRGSRMPDALCTQSSVTGSADGDLAPAGSRPRESVTGAKGGSVGGGGRRTPSPRGVVRAVGLTRTSRSMSGAARECSSSAVFCAALVWECACRLRNERVLAREDVTVDGWSVLTIAKQSVRGEDWERYVEYYKLNVSSTLHRRWSRSEKQGSDSARFTVGWVWDHAVGKRMSAVDSRTLLQLSTQAGGCLSDVTVLDTIGSAFESGDAKGDARAAWCRLALCEVPKPTVIRRGGRRGQQLQQTDDTSDVSESVASMMGESVSEEIDPFTRCGMCGCQLGENEGLVCDVCDEVERPGAVCTVCCPTTDHHFSCARHGPPHVTPPAADVGQSDTGGATGRMDASRTIVLELDDEGRVPAIEGTSESAEVVTEASVAYPSAKMIPRSKQNTCGRRRRQVRGKRDGGVDVVGGDDGAQAAGDGVSGVVEEPTVVPSGGVVEGRMQSRLTQLVCDGPGAQGQLWGSATLGEMEAVMGAAHAERIGSGREGVRTDDVVNATESVTGCVTDDEVIRVG